MSTDLMIPVGNIPAYAMSESAKSLNDAAGAGISAGAPPSIKLNGKQFMLVDSSGTETPFPMDKLQKGSDGNYYMPVIVLAARPTLVKSLYLTAYDPKEEGRGPDCFSNDAVKPDASVPNPQAATCAACPQNAFGTGKDAKGNPTGGKACADSKLVAVFVVDHGVHKLRIPPASLREWGTYVKQLTSHNVGINRVVTFVGFDPKESFPKLVFRFGNWLPKESIPAIEHHAQSVDTQDCIAGFNAVASAPALPAPEQQVAPVIEPPKAEPAPVEPPAPEPAQQAAPALDLGLGLSTPPAQPEPQTQPEPPKEAAPASGGITDQELAKQLGLPL